MNKGPRCKHRHSPLSHPNCFKGVRLMSFEGELVEPSKKYLNTKELERETGIPWYEQTDEHGEPYYRIGFFDLETDGLKADFGTLLSWAIKDLDGGTTYSKITKKELFNGTVDKRLVRQFLEAIEDYDILVGYYSTNFDMKFIRAKALHYGFDFPGYTLMENPNGKFYWKPEMMHWDLFYTVRKSLGISRKSLEVACDYMGIPAKQSPLSREMWRKAKYGDSDALKFVLQHNIEDVESTEELFKRLQKFTKWNQRGA